MESNIENFKPPNLFPNKKKRENFQKTVPYQRINQAQRLKRPCRSERRITDRHLSLPSVPENTVRLIRASNRWSSNNRRVWPRSAVKLANKVAGVIDRNDGVAYYSLRIPMNRPLNASNLETRELLACHHRVSR